MKKLNEKGLTLVEILAVVVISSIMIIFTGSIIVNSMKNQERIAAEAQLRNEADIIMAGLMKDLFSLKESEIDRVGCGTITGAVDTPLLCVTETESLPDEELEKVNAAKQTMINCSATENCEQYALVYLTDAKKIGFQGETIFTKDGQFSILDNDITLQPLYTIEMKMSSETGTNSTPTSIIVTFELFNELRNIVQTFQNEVIIVDNL